MDKIYTIDQVANLLQLSVITIRRYIKSGKLTASKIGPVYRIQESDVKEFLRKTRVSK